MEAPKDTASFVRQQKQALTRFGRMLRKWRELNGWTLYTPGQWGKAAGFLAPDSPKLSRLENANVQNPETQTLFRIADVNLRIAKKDWGHIPSVSLRMLVVTAQPIVDEKTNEPWGPREFWAAMMGLASIPAHLLVEDPPFLDAEIAAQLSQQWHEMFLKAVNENNLKPLIAAKKAALHLPTHHRARASEVLLMGPDKGAVFTVKELEAQWFGEWPIEKALSSWIQNLNADETP